MYKEMDIKDIVDKILCNEKKWIAEINDYFYKNKDIIFKHCATMFYIYHFDYTHNSIPKYNKKYCGAEKAGYINNQKNLYDCIKDEYSKNNKFYINEFEEYFIDVSLSFSIKIIQNIIKETFPKNTPEVDIIDLREELLILSFCNSYMEFCNFVYDAWSNEFDMKLIDFLMLGRNSIDEVYNFCKEYDINNDFCKYYEKNNILF